VEVNRLRELPGSGSKKHGGFPTSVG